MKPNKCKLCGSEAFSSGINAMIGVEEFYCSSRNCQNFDVSLSLDEWNAANPVTLRDEINDYYEKRGLKTPDAIEALMWLISEIGELVEAYMKIAQLEYAAADGGDTYPLYLFQGLLGWCGDIERAVAEQSGWVRNNQPKWTYDLPGECADVRMMLEVFCQQARLPESGVCLRAKMERKLKEIEKFEN